MLLFRDGREQARQLGLTTKAKLLARLGLRPAPIAAAGKLSAQLG